MILDPRGSTFVEWADSMNDELSGFGPLPRVDDEKEWQSWALVVCSLPGISAQQPPNPYGFEGWMEWADAFNRVVRSDR